MRKIYIFIFLISIIRADNVVVISPGLGMRANQPYPAKALQLFKDAKLIRYNAPEIYSFSNCSFGQEGDINALNDVIRWAKSSGDDVIAEGFSKGASTLINSLAVDSQGVKALILDSPVADFNNIFERQGFITYVLPFGKLIAGFLGKIFYFKK